MCGTSVLFSTGTDEHGLKAGNALGICGVMNCLRRYRRRQHSVAWRRSSTAMPCPSSFGLAAALAHCAQSTHRTCLTPLTSATTTICGPRSRATPAPCSTSGCLCCTCNSALIAAGAAGRARAHIPRPVSRLVLCRRRGLSLRRTGACLRRAAHPSPLQVRDSVDASGRPCKVSQRHKRSLWRIVRQGSGERAACDVDERGQLHVSPQRLCAAAARLVPSLTRPFAFQVRRLHMTHASAAPGDAYGRCGEHGAGGCSAPLRRLLNVSGSRRPVCVADARHADVGHPRAWRRRSHGTACTSLHHITSRRSMCGWTR